MHKDFLTISPNQIRACPQIAHELWPGKLRANCSHFVSPAEDGIKADLISHPHEVNISIITGVASSFASCNQWTEVALDVIVPADPHLFADLDYHFPGARKIT